MEKIKIFMAIMGVAMLFVSGCGAMEEKKSQTPAEAVATTASQVQSAVQQGAAQQ